jgi:hypothetical protein
MLFTFSYENDYSSGTVFVCICFKLHAQQPIDKLIAAERSFAATSKEQTTKIAFLSFLDSNCVGYRNGEQVNLLKNIANEKRTAVNLPGRLNLLLFLHQEI